MNQFSRTQLIFGEDGMKKLSQSRVAVFGLGGVGGYVTEALARSGIGALDLIDNDTVSLTNLNRQILALHSTIGKNKTEVAKQRVEDINPDCKVRIYNTFYLPETAGEFDFSQYDYIVDAVDTVTAKIALAVNAKQARTPIISSMGTGNKTDPCSFVVTDIYSTDTDPLARIMRKELKKRGIKSLKVVYSSQKAVRPPEQEIELLKKNENFSKRDIPASTAFVPSTAGLIIASEVIKDLMGGLNV